MRKKTLLLAVVGVLATASAAYAGWVIFGGVTGSSADQPFATAQTQFAVTISGNGTAPPLDQQGDIQIPLTVTNNSGSVETVTALTPTYTTKDSSGADNSSTCASFLHTDPAQDDGSIVGVSIPAGGTISGHWDTNLASNAPIACAGGSYKVSFTGTTSP